MIFLTLLGEFACKFFGKKCSTIIVGKSVASYALYNIFMGVIAVIFFFITGGFSAPINLKTLGYAALYAIISLIALAVGLIAYRFANISTITLITGTCGIVTTSLFGAILFHESFSPSTVIRIVLMLVATSLSFIDRREPVEDAPSGEKSRKKNSLWVIVIVVIMLAYQSAAAIVQKYFSQDPSVTSENSFFLYSNLMIVAVSLFVFALDSTKNREHGREACRMFRFRLMFPVVANVLASVAGSLIGIFLIARLPLSVYSPLLMAIGLLGGVLGSIAHRERLGVCSYLGAALALITVFI